MVMLPLVVGGPLLLLPLHVVFLELIIDPACSIVFEREAAPDDIMRRPPRPPEEHLLGVRSVLGCLAQGVVMFATVAAIYFLARANSLDSARVGALSFTALVAGNLGLIVVYRSGTSLWKTLRHPNRAFWVIALGALAVLTVVTRFEGPARWFGFSPPPMGSWWLALLLPMAVAGMLKIVQRGRRSAIATGPSAK